MNIGIALLRSSPDGSSSSGDFASVDTFAAHLVESGVQVTLLAPKLNRRLTYRKKAYTPVEWSDSRLLSNILRYVREARRLSREVDLLACHLLFPSFSIVGDLVSWGTDTPIVAHFGIPLIARWSWSDTLSSGARLWYLSRRLVNNWPCARLSRFCCDAYVVSSQYQRQQLLALGVEEKKAIVIPNCTNVRYYRKSARYIARRALGLPADAALVCYLGHPTPTKGIQYLIEAFPLVLARHPNSKLVLALDRPNGFRGKLVGQVQLLGLERKVTWLDRVDVPRLLSAADVLVLPYLTDFGTHMFPSSMLEALSVGVPLVSSDLPIIREVITDGQTGLLAPAGDSVAIAERILRLLADANLRESMVAAQREVAHKRFDARGVIEKYLHLCERVIDGKRKVR